MNYQNFTVEELSLKHKKNVLNFSDQFIGKNYFNETNFSEQIELSLQSHLNSSLVLFDNKKLIAIRISYAPKNWLTKIKVKHLVNQNIDLNKVGYFKSLFIHQDYQGQKLGPKLSSQSVEVLKQMGCEYILSHSWIESPNDSSVRYLQKYGFKNIGTVTNFWKDVDYLCSGCTIQPCICNAAEMLLKI